MTTDYVTVKKETNYNQYIGVFENTKVDVELFPHRAAIKLPRNMLKKSMDGKIYEWQQIGLFADPQVAARAYNMYALAYYGDKAILNRLPKQTKARDRMWQEFLELPYAQRINAQAVEAASDMGGSFKYYEPRVQAKSVASVKGAF